MQQHENDTLEYEQQNSINKNIILLNDQISKKIKKGIKSIYVNIE